MYVLYSKAQFVLVLYIGSIVRKARAQGVKVETLKLPPVTALASGKWVKYLELSDVRTRSCVVIFSYFQS